MDSNNWTLLLAINDEKPNVDPMRLVKLGLNNVVTVDWRSGWKTASEPHLAQRKLRIVGTTCRAPTPYHRVDRTPVYETPEASLGTIEPFCGLFGIGAVVWGPEGSQASRHSFDGPPDEAFARQGFFKVQDQDKTAYLDGSKSRVSSWARYRAAPR